VTRILVRTPRAIEDLIEIWTYVARDDRAAADRLLDSLDARMAVLREQPYLGRARADLAPGLRSLTEGSYLILYRVALDRIEIVRCVHGARRLRRLVS
jgi:toxin ParE1/3/4